MQNSGQAGARAVVTRAARPCEVGGLTMEAAAMVGLCTVLLVWLYTLTHLMFRKPHAG